MNSKNNIKSDWIRIIIGAIFIFVITVIILKLFSGPLQSFASSPISFLLIISPYFFIPAVVNKGKTVKDSISTGVIIAILGGILFLVYWPMEGQNNATSHGVYYVDWGFYGTVIIGFIAIFVIAAICGSLLSYFIRKIMCKKKSIEI